MEILFLLEKASVIHSISMIDRGALLVNRVFSDCPIGVGEIVAKEKGFQRNPVILLFC